MKCPDCNSEWKTDEKVSSSLTSCPFCGKSLVKEAPKKYDNSKDALAAIMKQFGPDVLLGKLNAHFPDFASVLEGDKRLVYAVHELGAAKVLKSSLAASQADKEIAVKIAIRTLTEAYISQDGAETIVHEFAAALGWQVNKPVPQSEPPSPPPQPAAAPKPAVPQTRPPPAAPIPNSGINIAPKIGSIIPFGPYNWQVLDVQGGETLIITEEVIERRAYNEKYEDTTWETCDLRKYLNGEFIQRFTKEQQGRIVEKQINNPDNLWYGTAGGNDTRDKVFLLSLEEADKYFGDSGDYRNRRRKRAPGAVPDSNGSELSNNHNYRRVARDGNGNVSDWYLRSPAKYSDNAAAVNIEGPVLVSGGGGEHVNDTGGVRPALWLRL